MERSISLIAFAGMLTAWGMSGCAKPGDEDLLRLTRRSSHLYLVSGACYGGTASVASGSSTVARYSMFTGTFQDVVWDYATESPGDVPVGIAELNEDELLVTVHSSWGNRIDRVAKDGSSATPWLANAAYLTGDFHAFSLMADGSPILTRGNVGGVVEKLTTAGARLAPTGLSNKAFVEGPVGAGGCGATTTLSRVTGAVALDDGKLILTNAGNSPNNRLLMVSATGYGASANCLAATQVGASASSNPTALLLHSSGKVVVASAGTLGANNYLHTYDVDPASPAFTQGTRAYQDPAVVNGVTALAESPVSGEILVANGQQDLNTIEKFSFDPTTRTATRVGAQPFIPASVFTRCVSGMIVGY
ncbi:MAG: hypothetical protein AB7P04_13525 [Bacteriovoracia bacterium]